MGFGSEKVPWLEEGVDLGVKVTRNGKFFAHVNEKVNRCYSIIGQIRRNLKVRTERSMTLIWNTLILPTLCYASPAWYQNYPGINRSLNEVYKKFWKLFWGPIPDGVLTPVEYIEIQSMKVAKKILDGDYPVDKNIFEMSRGIRSINSLSLNCRKDQSTVRKETFSSRIVDDWNRLDANMKTGPMEDFASHCRIFITEKHRADEFPYTRERISQRTPYY